jgi:hypothetical protein
MEAGLREDAAFAELARAFAHRQRIDAKLAVYDDHWEGYEAALEDMQAAVQAYWEALQSVREARSRHFAHP